MYFRIFLIVEFELAVDDVKMLRSEIIPPTSGRIPRGSGDERSLNHSMPSFRIAGLIS
jgi:hypothetical protein